MELPTSQTFSEKRADRRALSWIENYRKKRCTAEEAVKVIKSGDCVYVHPGCAEPEHLVKAMVARAPELHEVSVIHILTSGNADYVRPEMSGRFRHIAFFAGANVRSAINEGRADFIPIFLSEIEALFSSGAFPVDVALLHLSPRMNTDSAALESAWTPQKPRQNVRA